MDYSKKLAKGGRDRHIDALRTLSMMAVVFTHNVFPGVPGDIVSAWVQFAVPTFFMISGYFLFNSNAEAVLYRAKKTVKLAIEASIIYLLYNLIFNGVEEIIVDMSLVALIKWVLLSAPACGLPVHLWYLFALVYCYLLFAVLLKAKWLDKISRFIVILLFGIILIAVVLPEIGAIELHDTLYRNAWMMGMPFMALGYEIRKRIQNKQNEKTAIYLCVVVIGLLIANIESVVFNVAGMRIGSTFITSIAMFMFAVTSEFDFGWIATIGRRYSRDVYVWHVLVAGILRRILSLTGVYMYSATKWSFPIMVLLLSIGLAILLDCIRNRLTSAKPHK